LDLIIPWLTGDRVGGLGLWLRLGRRLRLGALVVDGGGVFHLGGMPNCVGFFWGVGEGSVLFVFGLII
jgi:hypothetical protein